jgi:hypothetical protein
MWLGLLHMKVTEFFLSLWPWSQGNVYLNLQKNITFCSYNKMKFKYFNTVKHHLITTVMLVMHSMRGFLDNGWGQNAWSQCWYDAFISISYSISAYLHDGPFPEIQWLDEWSITVSIHPKEYWNFSVLIQIQRNTKAGSFHTSLVNHIYQHITWQQQNLTQTKFC